MADPKYANLPGIAYDQPDVYETSDLPEADQRYPDDNNSAENDNIQRMFLDINQSYQAFRGAQIDASRADFSQPLSLRQCIGYSIPTTQYELNVPGGGDRPETPLQKYQRLKVETNELLEEIHRLRLDKVTADRVDPNLAKGIEALGNQLMEIRLEQTIARGVLASLNDPQEILQKELLTHIERVKEPAKKPPSGASAQDKLLYELHYKPELSKLDTVSRTADLEQRIQHLENLLGTDADQLKNLSANTNQSSLLGSVSLLTTKLNLLEPAHLDQMDTRLTALAVKLTQLSDKRPAVEEAERASKAAQLYESLNRIESLCSELPAVTDRLLALSDLHEQAMQFSQALSQLNTAQHQVTTSLAADRQLLIQVQNTMEKNVENLQKNLANLNDRVSALKK